MSKVFDMNLGYNELSILIFNLFVATIQYYLFKTNIVKIFQWLDKITDWWLFFFNLMKIFYVYFKRVDKKKI